MLLLIAETPADGSGKGKGLMRTVKSLRTYLSLCLAILLTCGWIPDNGIGQAVTDNHSAGPSQAISIGGEPVVVLQRPKSSDCLLYTSPSPRDRTRSRMPSSA